MSMTDDSNVRTTRSENLHPDSEAGKTSERPAGDPLAELARLIGQDDLFNSMRKDAAQAEQRATDRRPATVEPGPAPDWLSRARPAAGEFRRSSGEASRTRSTREPTRTAIRLQRPIGNLFVPMPVQMMPSMPQALKATSTTRATPIRRARSRRRPTISRPHTSSPMPAMTPPAMIPILMRPTPAMTRPTRSRSESAGAAA